MNKIKMAFAGQKWQEVFGIDIRSLALARVLFAVLLLSDLAVRATSFTAHYGNAGVFPREALITQWDKPWVFSIHLINGTWQIQVLFFILATFFALMLLVGWKTRLATIMSWFLLLSLQNSNPMILNGGDIVFRVALFWAMFLPLGKAYSVDRAVSFRENPVAEKRIASVWTAAYLLQIGFFYLFSGFSKNAGEDWISGTSVYYAVSLDQFTTPIGEFLLGFPILMMFLTFSVLWLQRVSFLLLFSPFFTRSVRTLGMVLLMLMHAAFFASLNLGLFSFVCISALTAFIHTDIWDVCMKKLRTTKRLGLKIYYDMECGFCKKSVFLIRTFFLLSETPLLPAQKYPGVYKDMESHDSWVVEDSSGMRYFGFSAAICIAKASPILRLFVPLIDMKKIHIWGEKIYRFIADHRSRVCEIEATRTRFRFSLASKKFSAFIGIFLIVYVFFWNLTTIPGKRFVSLIPDESRWIGSLLGLDQKWSVFAPNPLKDDGWYILIGQLENGKEVDVFQNGKKISFEKPRDVSAMYTSERWRKYHMNLYLPEFTGLRKYYASYLCREWNNAHSVEDAIKHIAIVFMLERTQSNYATSSPEKTILYEEECVTRPRPVYPYSC